MSNYQSSKERPYHVSCGAVVMDENNRVLFMSRVSDGRSHVLPRGTLEDNETPKQCVEREVLEETGVSIEAQEYIGHMTYTSSHGDYEFDKVVLFFAAKPLDFGAGSMDGEYDRVDWVDLEEAIEKAEHRNGSEMIIRAAKVRGINLES